jgi:hypothetical protein
MTAINTMEPSLLRYETASVRPGLASAPRDTGTCR